ncbi:unnamed protein product [Porites evermanni]|uniref:Uncharacterized protein n=1 Tax=Porites evermanni TaxID=104178 RepID=A0ABN8QSZ2_9CNID|nr:unnamed protein product [Porites evermanni]
MMSIFGWGWQTQQMEDKGTTTNTSQFLLWSPNFCFIAKKYKICQKLKFTNIHVHLVRRCNGWYSYSHWRSLIPFTTQS